MGFPNLCLPQAPPRTSFHCSAAVLYLPVKIPGTTNASSSVFPGCSVRRAPPSPALWLVVSWGNSSQSVLSLSMSHVPDLLLTWESPRDPQPRPGPPSLTASMLPLMTSIRPAKNRKMAPCNNTHASVWVRAGLWVFVGWGYRAAHGAHLRVPVQVGLQELLGLLDVDIPSTWRRW